MNKKVLIVGGVAGGASAAARLRRLDEEIEIIMFERDGYISYANCGLPYYIGGTIEERDNLLVQTPEAMKERFRIDVRIHSEVVGIDTSKKCVIVDSSLKGRYEESYDNIILSPGAKALRSNIPGIDHERIFTLRNVPDTDRIKAFVDHKKPKRAIVIGGGFVGVEMAENLVEKGVATTLVEAAPHILAPFDEDMVIAAERELEQNGVKLLLNDGITGFSSTDRGVMVELKSGKRLEGELIILSMGVRPDTGFLKDSGIILGDRGHIKVNSRMETNIEGIYAVGDAVEGIDLVTGGNTAVALAGPANKQGRIAADNIAGISSEFEGFLGTSIIKVFGLTAARTGANERTLKLAGMDYKMVQIHPMSHASYYPGAYQIALKLLFDKEGKVLGAQATGHEGVDKRIDVIATVMSLGGNIIDLTKLDLSYAPPFSSAKDPVNMAGFAADNILKGLSHVTTWEEVYQGDENPTLLDVRTKEEFELGHMEGAINIPLNELRDRLNELNKEEEIKIYCQVGLRGYVADRILTQHGFTALNIAGGYISAKDYMYQNAILKEDYQVKAADIPLVENETPIEVVVDKKLDARGICCPGPLLRVKEVMDQLIEGEVLEIVASDPGFYEDVNAWCKNTGNSLLQRKRDNGTITALIQKENRVNEDESLKGVNTAKNNKTIVVFSGDLDKAIASFIIANGAASMGKKVTMFFTFWGLNILRKPEKIHVKKGLIDAMFGKMMPRGSKKLKLSNMNMMGMGAQMIRKVMKDKNVDSLESLIEIAIANGVEIVACQMSMDVMGLKKEELINGVNIGGVGYYLGEAEESNVNLFI